MTVAKLARTEFYGTHLADPHSKSFTDKVDEVIDELNLQELAVHESGALPVAIINLGTNPTHQDDLTIGGDVYEFIDTGTGTVVASDTNVAVEIGGDAATTLASLVAAINGTAGAHATVTKADTVTPAVNIGAEAVFASAPGGGLLTLIPSGAAGVNPSSDPDTYFPADPLASLALSDNLTAAVAWTLANFNVGAGTTRGKKKVTRFTATVTTAMITAGRFDVGLAFTPTGATVEATDSAGVPRVLGGDSFTLGTNTIGFTLNGGGPDLVDTDVLYVTCWE